MYIILVYDINQKRVGKMLKLCRKYLNWIQNSVFEGELSEVQLKELVYSAKEIMKEEEGDSIIVFKTRQEKWLDKEIIGFEKNPLDKFI
ncbi:MAG: CRISPR-associated endonuclease Cas2 [Bacteroidota bacterium]